MKPEQWVIEGETGTSSKTIWAVMMGVVNTPRQCDGWHYDVPHDPDDFSRCYKLIKLFPEWKHRLNEVSEVFPKWKPFIREWNKLEAMYPQWLVALENYYQERRRHPRKAKIEDGMYEFMQTLYHEGMLLDGWQYDGYSSYHCE